jgi:hypothetical protein
MMDDNPQTAEFFHNGFANELRPVRITRRANSSGELPDELLIGWNRY